MKHLSVLRSMCSRVIVHRLHPAAFLCFVLGCLSAKAESPAARIVGPLSDGSPPPEAASTAPRSNQGGKVLSSRTRKQGGRLVTIQRIEPPAVPETLRNDEPPTAEELEAAAAFKATLEQQKPVIYFTAAATVYDHKTTHVRWWSHKDGMTKQHECHSNVDWNNLEGFHTFETGGQRYTFLLFTANGSLEDLRKARLEYPELKLPEMPANLPDLAAAGPRYTTVDPEEDDDAGLDFMEGVHSLYALEQDRLVQARRDRERNRKLRLDELRRNPPQPKDITIRFWKNKTTGSKGGRK